MEQQPLIEGYEAPIHQAVWQRLFTWGAPRLWSNVWVVLCLYGSLVLLTVAGWRWALVPLGAWAIGQGFLVLLTLWDPSFDNVLLAQYTRRYADRYDAG